MLNHVWATFAWLGFFFFGWFAAGALFYVAHRDGDRRVFAAAISLAIVSALLYDMKDWSRDIVALLIVIAIFSVSLATTWGRTIASWRGFTFMGFVSYPLYLIHNNIAVGGAALMARVLPTSWASATPIAPVLPIAIVIAVAWAIARYIEPAMREQLRAAFAFVRHRPPAEAV